MQKPHAIVPTEDTADAYEISASRILRIAIISRFVIFVVSFLVNLFVDDYDSATSIVLPPISNTYPVVFLLFNKAISVFLRWDAFYFLHIAEEGYVWEQELAFFPLVPYLARIIAKTILSPLAFYLHERYVILLAGIFIANVSFVFAAVALYRMTLAFFPKQRTFAFLTSFAFILTPSNIFMSAFFTESTFALLTFTGMRFLAERNYMTAAIIWFFAGLTRSNAIVFVGFFIYELLIKSLITGVGFLTLIRRLITLAICSSTVLASFAIFQKYAFQLYCSSESASDSAVNQREWCLSPIPIVYTFVQSHYWNVGFLRYYEIKQIPNFLFAAPMITLSLCGIWEYASADWARFLTLGFRTLAESESHETYIPDKISKSSKHGDAISMNTSEMRTPEKNTASSSVSTFPTPLSTPSRWKWRISPSANKPELHYEPLLSASSNSHSLQSPFFSTHIIPHIYLWVALLLQVSLAAHVQIITRFFSGLPVVFWFVAHLWMKGRGKIVIWYFVIYAAIGIVLFASFLPPA